VFFINSLLKTSRPGKHLSALTFKAFTDENLCIVKHVKKYLEMTQQFRSDDSLLISYVKPHKKVCKDSLARCIKEVLSKSGIDTSMFSSHSTRSASTSCLKSSGVPVDLILSSVGWSNARTFAKFYDKPIDETKNFGEELLKSLK
jgi:hypothetical protein